MKATSVIKWIFIFISLVWIPNTIAAETLPQFVDITRAAGIDFVHNTGAFGEKYLPEEIASGCAFIDYDNDEWQDILLVNGKDWQGHSTGKRQTMVSIETIRTELSQMSQKLPDLPWKSTGSALPLPTTITTVMKTCI